MKNRMHWFLAILFIGSVFFFFSCAPAYVPNMVHTPMFYNRGEVNASVGMGTHGLDPQIALSVSDHIGIMANGSISYPSNDTSLHNHQFLEFGMGYFTHLGEGVFELYGGYGKGFVESTFTSDFFGDKYSEANYHRLFIQPGVGASGRFFDMGFSSRIVFIDMEVNDPDFIRKSEFDIFIEPAYTLRVGIKNVKVYSQMGWSFAINEPELQYEYRRFMFSVGLNLHFGRRLFD